MAKRRHAFTVTGPGVEVGYQDLGPALSRSITEASRVDVETTFYVRDAKGDSLGYSHRDEHGIITTVRR